MGKPTSVPISRTGYTGQEYLREAVKIAGGKNALTDQIGMSREIAKRALDDIPYRPETRTLLQVERTTGLTLDEWIPEIHEGIRRAEEMRNGGLWPRREDMERNGAWSVTYARYRAGEQSAEDLPPHTLIGLCKIAEEVVKPRRLKRIPEECTAQEALEREMEGAQSERAKAYGVYRWATGRLDQDDNAMRRVGKGLWTFETEHYDGEIDLNARELRITYRKTGVISVRRSLGV